MIACDLGISVYRNACQGSSTGKDSAFWQTYSRNQRARLDHWLRLCMVHLPQGKIDQNSDQWISGYPLKGKVFGETASKATQVLVQSKRGVFALAPIQAQGSFELNLCLR